MPFHPFQSNAAQDPTPAAKPGPWPMSALCPALQAGLRSPHTYRRVRHAARPQASASMSASRAQRHAPPGVVRADKIYYLLSTRPYARVHARV